MLHLRPGGDVFGEGVDGIEGLAVDLTGALSGGKEVIFGGVGE